MKINEDTPNIGSNISCIFREGQDCNHPNEYRRKERSNTLYPYERCLNFNRKSFINICAEKINCADIIGDFSIRFFLPSRVNIY
jgi:hypothetical protein